MEARRRYACPLRPLAYVMVALGIVMTLASDEPVYYGRTW
jgi:hypothetical protein